MDGGERGGEDEAGRLFDRIITLHHRQCPSS